MSITREFNLFLNAGAASPLVINVNQYDQGEVWQFTLYSEKGIQYTPSTGAIVGIKSDNLGIINTGTVVDGKVVITETQQMTAAPGRAVFELLLDDQTHGTANFYVQVEPKPGNNADLSESDLSLIQQAIDSTNPEAIAQGVSDWMDDNLAPEEWVLDSSLSVSGAAADAKATGDAIAGYVSIIQHAQVGMPEYNTLKVTRPNGMISTVDLPMVTNGVISEDNLPDIGGGGGLTDDIKQALLQLAQKVAYIDENGQDYYDDLYDALYPPIVVTAITLNTNSLSFATLNSTQQLTATTTPSGGAVTWSSSDTSVATVSQTGVVTSVAYGNATITATSGSVSATCSVSIAQATVTSISAVYTQSGTVYDTDSLDSLKSDLVVTASWSNGTTSTVASADYTLSGTLTTGTSTITVSYGGKTTTFTVTVTAAPPYVTDGLIAYWDGIDNTGSGHDSSVSKWTDLVNGYELPFRETTHTTWNADSINFDGNKAQGLLTDGVLWTTPENATIEIVLDCLATGTQALATLDLSETAVNNAYESRRVALYSDNSVGFVGASGYTYDNSESALTGIKKLVATYTGFTVNKAFCNNTELSLGSNTHSLGASVSQGRKIRIGIEGTSTTNYPYTGKVYAIRVYNRILTSTELTKNFNYDNDRFSLGL